MPMCLMPVEEEDHAEQEQDVVVAGHHVFGAQVHEGQQIDARDFLDVALVTLGDSVGKDLRRAQEQAHEEGKEQEETGMPDRPWRTRQPVVDMAVHEDSDGLK